MARYGVHLDNGHGLAECGPRYQGRAQVNGRQVEGMGSLVEFGGQALVSVQAASVGDQQLAEIGMDVPIAPLVGTREGRAADRCVEAGMVALGRVGDEASLDVAQTLATREFGKHYGAILLGTAQEADEAIPVVASDDPSESGPREESRHLSNYGPPGMHATKLTPPASDRNPR